MSNQATDISTHTLRGERDYYSAGSVLPMSISTHTLRGERDTIVYKLYKTVEKFQLTRSVGSVTANNNPDVLFMIISTHTLRGERDEM